MKEEKYYIAFIGDEDEISEENYERVLQDAGEMFESDGDALVFVTAKHKDQVQKEYGIKKFESFKTYLADEIRNNEIRYVWDEIANEEELLTHLYNVQIDGKTVNKVIKTITEQIYELPENEAMSIISEGNYGKLIDPIIKKIMVEMTIKELQNLIKE